MEKAKKTGLGLYKNWNNDSIVTIKFASVDYMLISHKKIGYYIKYEDYFKVAQWISLTSGSSSVKQSISVGKFLHRLGYCPVLVM